MTIGHQLHIADYVVLAAVLVASLGVGIYHALTGGKQQTNEEFLLANRKMNPLPVGFSIAATFVTATGTLGITAEIYVYGYMFWLICVASFFVGLVIARFFIPLYFRFKFTSVNEVSLYVGKSIRV